MAAYNCAVAHCATECGLGGGTTTPGCKLPGATGTVTVTAPDGTAYQLSCFSRTMGGTGLNAVAFSVTSGKGSSGPVGGMTILFSNSFNDEGHVTCPNWSSSSAVTIDLDSPCLGMEGTLLAPANTMYLAGGDQTSAEAGPGKGSITVTPSTTAGTPTTTLAFNGAEAVWESATGTITYFPITGGPITAYNTP
jgi:hypothetical protein